MSEAALSILLNDHLAGAAAAIPLGERCVERNKGTALADAVDRVVSEIREDKLTLERIIETLGFKTSGVKQAAGWAAEKVGQARIKLADVQDHGAATLLELQGLIIGIEGKKTLWEALDAVQDKHPLLQSFNYVTLRMRADRQQAALREHHDAVARQCLG